MIRQALASQVAQRLRVPLRHGSRMRRESDPWFGKTPWRRNPRHYSCLEGHSLDREPGKLWSHHLCDVC